MVDGPRDIGGAGIQRAGDFHVTRADEGRFGDRRVKIARGVGRVVLGIVTFGISEAVIRGIRSYRVRQETYRVRQETAAQKEQIRVSNKAIANTYSRAGGMGKDRVDLEFVLQRSKFGLPKKLPSKFGELDKAEIRHLRTTIKNRIERAGRNGRMVTSETAEGIVKDVVRSFINNKIAVLRDIDTVKTSMGKVVSLDSGEEKAGMMKGLKASLTEKGGGKLESDGIALQMKNDMNRGTYKIGGRTFVKDKAGSVDQLKKFCGENKVLLGAVSRLAHQGLFAEILTTSQMPFFNRQLMPGFVARTDSKHPPEYTITRTEGGDIRIRATSRTQIDRIVKMSADMNKGNMFIPNDDSALLKLHVDVTIPGDQFQGKDLETMKIEDVNVVLNHAEYSWEM